MPTRDFFQSDAKKRVAHAIEEIEKLTAAEVVVAVRRRSGHYRHTDLYVGSVFAMGALLVLLFHPEPFAEEWMPANVVLAFAVGALACANVDTVRRVLTSRTLMDANARVQARAAFYDMGILRTRGRTGILVFVAIFERRVFVVPDIGVKASELGDEWTKALAALDASVRAAPDFDAFLAALGSMAPPLARVLPAQPDDIDELPNEPAVA